MIQTGPSSEAIITRFLSSVSNVIILNTFAYNFNHEVGFAADLRAIFKSLLDRQDLSETGPMVIVAFRDLDEHTDRDLFAEIKRTFPVIINDIMTSVADDDPDIVKTLVS